MTKGDKPAIKKSSTPKIVLRLLFPIIPEVIAIIPTNASSGGMICENSNELSTSGLYAIYFSPNFFYNGSIEINLQCTNQAKSVVPGG